MARTENLKKACKQAIEKTLDQGFDLSGFLQTLLNREGSSAETQHSCGNAQEEDLRKLHADVRLGIVDSCESEFEDICNSVDLYHKVCELEVLAKSDSGTSLLAQQQPPQDIVRPSTLALKQSELARLREMFSKLQQENAQLQHTVTSQRAHVGALANSLLEKCALATSLLGKTAPSV
eukprot:gnl/Hemi2/22557_TR7526_c0_g1_i1.p1 gnl/Hemi2/22557_TR7526_c0_g1~~gnl/Hemi2/22557_TR7526_c0_g1_i1.p1  ORF type:complete len:189 (+),score=51.60 gnl/Hemi2/22557_TR7526_c0_g1_i1:34-567(+)